MLINISTFILPNYLTNFAKENAIYPLYPIGFYQLIYF